MDPEQDSEFLWIAEMALQAPLPVGWTEHNDTEGNVFFHNKTNGESTYEHPMDESFRNYYKKVKSRSKSKEDERS